jgi:hypothetical protein
LSYRLHRQEIPDSLAAVLERATFETFERELNRLVELFGRRIAELKQPGYSEAQLRDDFLNPLFRALGWDMENRAGLIQKEREVEIESLTHISGGRKRADYLFRSNKRDCFVCEAKKPAEELHARYAFQAKRYAWNKGVFVALLTDFEELKIYVVGGKPHADEPHVGEWKSWHYRQYPLIARELWNLIACDNVSAGSIDAALEALPKKATGSAKGKAKQQWLIKPDRTRALDTDFLNFLDETRRDLASDIFRNNDHDEILDGNKLTEACQRIIDRILFLRICEDRDIDTGERLQSIVDKWRKNTGDDDTGRRGHQQPLDMREEPPADFGSSGIRAPKSSLWRAVVRHFRALDRRPPTHVPFFNGNLFKPHFTEGLIIGDEWLAGFISELSDDESPYLFNVIDVEILGSVYERFLGKVVRPQGRGITIEEKPEVRKAGGVYYTPKYIVDYIVEQTAGKLLDEIAAEKETEGVKAFATRTEKLRILDPACGSGSFLIQAFERVSEHWQKRLTANLRSSVGDEVTSLKSKDEFEKFFTTNPAAVAWEKKHRPLCWIDKATGDVHLTVALKRQILTQNIYGVDLDSAAVEVTQLSLYLKMLENENRTTIERQRELLSDEKEIALLPPLQENIKCGNSLIASDFSMMSEDLVRVRAFDWPVQFASIMKSGGFDAIIGNPPYIRIQTMQETDGAAVEYLNSAYTAAKKGNYDIYVCFVERALKLINPTGTLGFILPHKFFNAQYGEGLREIISSGRNLRKIVHFGHHQIFEGATTYTCLLFLNRSEQSVFEFGSVPDLSKWTEDYCAYQRRILPIAEAKASEWNFNSGPEAGLIDRLFAMPHRLADVSHLFVGLQTDADDVFIMEFVHASENTVCCLSKATGKEHMLERGHLKRLLKGSLNVRRYELDSVTKLLIFPYQTVGAASVLIPEKDYKKRFPNTWQYLEENYSRLSKRNKGKLPDGWYGYVYKKNHTRFGTPKIVVPSLGTGSCFALDANGDYFFVGSGAGGGGGYGIIPTDERIGDIRFLLGLLNSRLLSFLIRKTSTPFRGGYIALNRQYIERLPIQLVDLEASEGKKLHDRMVQLVEKMLTLMPKVRAATGDAEKAILRNAVDATDQQIDELVYELYGLTKEEIALVEGAA